MVPIRVHFPGAGAFHQELKRRVSNYFETTEISERDQSRMYLKSFVILSTGLASYIGLVFFATTWWQALPCAIGLCMALAGVGFSIQHDANHGGYSEKRGVNRVMSYMMDLIGGSSYVWYYKHNIVHHTYTNVSGIDVDVDIQPFLRLAPDQAWKGYHRLQPFYIWLLYGLVPANWHFWSDYRDLVNGHICGQPFPKPTKMAIAGTILGKLFFYSWSLVLPMFFHPFWMVIGVHLGISLALGMLLTTVFQLAHCVEEADVITLDSHESTLETAWAEHQVRTTANFATKNPFLTWFLGGLNYQVEHHLFPKICHVHYPQLSPIVDQCCKDFGIPYNNHPTVREALRSHFNHVRNLSRKPEAPSPTPTDTMAVAGA